MKALLIFLAVSSALGHYLDKARRGGPFRGHRSLVDEELAYEAGREEGGADDSEVPRMLDLDDPSDQEHMRNFKKIAADIALFEEEYAKCLKDIPDFEFTETRVEECVGRNFVKVVIDIKYITMKVLSRSDTKIREKFIATCYVPAGADEDFSVGCDFLEKDVLDLLWNGLDFIKIVEANKDKYLKEYGKIPMDDYRKVIDSLADLSAEVFELLEEVDSHKEVTILRLKTLVDDITKVLIEEAKKNPHKVLPPELKHMIEITEEVEDDGVPRIDPDLLPPPQVPNADPQDFAVTPEQARKLTGHQTINHEDLRNLRLREIQQKIAQKKMLSPSSYELSLFSGKKVVIDPRKLSAQTPKLKPNSAIMNLRLRPHERISDLKFKSVHKTNFKKQRPLRRGY